MPALNANHDSHYDPRRFPEGFLWGTATSSYQVEGGNVHADWYAWERQPGKIADGTTSGRAVDHWERYKEDFAIAKEVLHNNAYRFSVEWSRLEPREGEWDEDAFAQYREMLSELKRQGMTVMLTVHHFTNPQWLARRGGWERGVWCVGLIAWWRIMPRAWCLCGSLVHHQRAARLHFAGLHFWSSRRRRRVIGEPPECLPTRCSASGIKPSTNGRANIGAQCKSGLRCRVIIDRKHSTRTTLPLRLLIASPTTSFTRSRANARTATSASITALSTAQRVGFSQSRCARQMHQIQL